VGASRAGPSRRSADHGRAITCWDPRAAGRGRVGRTGVAGGRRAAVGRPRLGSSAFAFTGLGRRAWRSGACFASRGLTQLGS
jgi:hypothetical protein